MKRVMLGLLFFVVTGVYADHGAFLYDAMKDPALGPASHQVNNPGQWIDNIQQFNDGAVSKPMAIGRLYPYAGDIETSCTDYGYSGGNCYTNCNATYGSPDQNIFVYYYTPAYGEASVSAYREAFPNAAILAIIDGSISKNSALFAALNNPCVAQQTANLLTNEICADPKVDGVLFDLEPFNFSSPGLQALLKQTSNNVVNSPCIGPGHSIGRYFGVFMNPNNVSNWMDVSSSMGQNGYLVVSGYDLGDQTPPTPLAINLYATRLTHMLQVMDAASVANKIRYTVALPAAASFSEFEQTGLYTPGENAPTYISVQPQPPAWAGITQLGYVQAARAVIMSTCKSPYYLGTDYWGWNQYVSPDPSNGVVLLPNIPSTSIEPGSAYSVVSYLQQFGT